MGRLSNVGLSTVDGPGVASNVFDLSDDLLGGASLDGYFTCLNPAWERTLGFSRAALMAQPFIEFVHPGDRERTVAEAGQLAAGGRATVEFQNRYATRDGGWCWLAWQWGLADGGYCFVVHDVTEKVAAEQRDHLLRHTVEGIDDAILTKTTDGVVTSWNRAAELQYGFSAGEAIGRHMNDLIVPEDLATEPMMIVERLLAGDGVRQYTTRRHTKGGAVLAVSLTASLLRDDDYRVLGVGVICRDLSEVDTDGFRHRAELDTLAWVGRIRDAIDDDRIDFHAQPIVGIGDPSTSYELLCRMGDLDGELIPPGRFLPAAENYGLIEELDLLAMDEAVRQIVAGHRVNINFSTATVGRRHIVGVVGQKLHAANADSSMLTIEITETALMKDIAAAQRFTAGLAALGCRVALDDFGTGFGSLTYLKKLSIDQLKIDTEFVRDLSSSRASQHVVKAVVALANDFGLETVAEGVEDGETLAMLEGYGVSHAQGYLIARPGPITQVLESDG